MSQQGNTLMLARASGRCSNCNHPAEKYAQETPGGLKGVWWCNPCDHVAFGGSSFFKLSESERSVGDSCENWPKVFVCHDCHREWERRMGTHPWRDAG